MEKATVEKWLNRMVRATKQFVNIEDLSDEFKWCNHNVHKVPDRPYVQLYNCLHEIAEMFDFEVTVDYESDKDICYMFTYKGVDFVQLDDKEN